ncbi:hypothetical protein AMJ83_05395 [candidate division WOR_3 bacterium SM23_42]|uniref:Uncharacterized protein n=1 Tax=candidate division WOR_3 bacterium SM23_42 TaxID=1703779 RepID=A0A0S8FT25_UNCW3|nr:MAG: hypothetical protein AMJ83_05395 [candidate division WOR_3 bacterium SM23_42]
MINLLLCFLLQVNIYPRNAMWDRYTIMPPLGKVKSIATSDLQVFAVSGQHLLFINKQSFTFEKSIYFDCVPELVGYDRYTNDLWIVCPDRVLRLSQTTYNLREYPISCVVYRFAIDASMLYIEGTETSEKYALDKTTGVLSNVSYFPQNLSWYKKTSPSDTREYPFLNPYYYYDDAQTSQMPFHQYAITSIYDDGMYLYVGTDQYGLLKYNKISLQNERIVHGPLDSRITTVKKSAERLYFLCTSGISSYRTGDKNWQYLRLDRVVTDIVTIDDDIFLARDNLVLRTSGSLEFPVGNFNTNVLSLGSDEDNIYVGTRSGMYKIIKGSSIEIPFGPDRYAVYYIHPTEKAVYVGGEFALYKYNKVIEGWSTIYNFGVKDIVSIENDIYSLGLNNQIIRYSDVVDDSLGTDSSWMLLPYFNIYDIDTDNDVLYCATYSGIYYYDPASATYKVIYNLPRIHYDYVFVIDERILAISKNSAYSLPLEYRD